MRKAKVFVLSTCDTCKRILKEVENNEKLEVVDIKVNPISGNELDELRAKVGGYIDLFNTRAKKIKELGISYKSLSDEDIRTLILQDYTFLRRPVFIVGNEVFAGNSKATVNEVKRCLESY